MGAGPGLLQKQQADQAPRRWGRQSRRQERGPGTQAPSPVAPPPPAPTSPASAPARRARRRGPGALLREERRRQLRTAADVLTAERVGDPASPYHSGFKPQLGRCRFFLNVHYFFHSLFLQTLYDHYNFIMNFKPPGHAAGMLQADCTVCSQPAACKAQWQIYMFS